VAAEGGRWQPRASGTPVLAETYVSARAGPTFFAHLQSPTVEVAAAAAATPLVPESHSRAPLLMVPRGTASGRVVRYIRGSLCFMANCFIIFDIFPVYGRGSAFCFMAVYCA